MDGFDHKTNVKVIMATNKIETLDPALIRPGRIDRKISFPLPDQKTLRKILSIHSSKMTLNDDVDLDEEDAASSKTVSGAEQKQQRSRNSAASGAAEKQLIEQLISS